MAVFAHISRIFGLIFLLLLERSICGFSLGNAKCFKRNVISRSCGEAAISPKCKIDRSFGPTEYFARTSSSNLQRLFQIRGGQIAPYNLGISGVVILETIAWLKIWTELAKRGVLPSTLTRKIIHSGSAPLFIMHWPLFSRDPHANVIAAMIPLLQIGRLLHAGLVYRAETVNAADGNPTHAKNELVAAVSRTGNQREALGGPLIYSIILFLGTFFFFRDSPVGIIAICQMAAGDGLADIIGRRFGKVKWPFSERKSILGSAAFMLGGFFCSFVGLWWMNVNDFLHLDLRRATLPLLAISLISTIVELFPVVDDNISVPLVAALLSWWWL